MLMAKKQREIEGQIGKTLEDDIRHIRDNAVSLKIINESVDVPNDNGAMKTIFDASVKVDNERSVILTTMLEITNTGEKNVNFEVINLENIIHYGVIQPGKILSLSSERNDLRVRTDGPCRLSYTIKHI
jgi:hypothetical protein